MVTKSLVIAGLLVAGMGAARAADDGLAAAGLAPIAVVGFSDSVPRGMPLFAALPRLAPGAEADLRDVGASGLVAFRDGLPTALDPNADIATASTGR
ncbi:hypothetical protein M446_6551 [Methylobacterium sp. 4-46]|uniref:hypothetical protein n=1 Tax=unclassified Methylobacterium TaxID=2615210 RepID=UPI000152DDFC|nr:MULTISPECIES: hypothetical protein [Methylobacterium]ACA20807.1 hypothetical protein M446_6551 [Methylobacterium sp. 4-46]WFT79963.1 hypothetical protein QA634_33075 [Methylobacterium nodulans]